MLGGECRGDAAEQPIAAWRCGKPFFGNRDFRHRRSFAAKLQDRFIARKWIGVGRGFHEKIVEVFVDGRAKPDRGG
jgi:hypothetical protein